MKNFLALIFFTFIVSTNVFTQNATDSIPSAYKGEWLNDLQQAYTLSKQTGKPIMADFTGTDWCGWCIKLSKEVFSTAEFKEWATKNVILLEVDFPRYKKLPDNIVQQNYNLQEALGVRGYPTIWIFNVDKDEAINQFKLSSLGSLGYMSGGPTVWLQSADLILNKQN